MHPNRLEVSPMKAQRSAIGAVLLAVFALGALAPKVIRDIAPLYGEFSFATAPDGIVTDADPSTGLRPGDKVEWAKVPLADRYGSIRRPLAGITVVYPFLRGGVEHYARLRPVRLSDITPLADKIVAVAKLTAWIFFILVALVIVLKRPSLMTWGFYVYALGNTQDSAAGLSFLPTIPFYAIEFWAFTLGLASAVGLTVFALLFPDNRAEGWRRVALRSVPWLLTGYMVFAFWHTYGAMTMRLDWAHSSLGLTAALLPYTVAWIALIESYRRSSGANRVRLRWAFIGVFIGTLLPGLLIPLQVITSGGTYLESEAFVAFANVAIPLTIGYAIIRHRVIDVEFIVNRAIVLGTVGALLAGTFILLDWLYTNYVTQTRWQIALGIAVAFALGWTARSGRRALIEAVDKVFFPKRHRVMRSIDELRIGLEGVTHPESVDYFVVKGAAEALQLDSAAVFVRMPDGGFLRGAAVGWVTGTAWHVLADDAIVTELAKRGRAATRLTEDVWSEVNVPTGAGRPILAVPLGSNRSAVAVYGAHADGRDIDPDETRGLMSLCSAAAAIRAA